jgi:multidrug efflux pump subunit AcrA (membrane-fusion protein)
VIALRAGVGDQVSRGAALLEIDSPDLAMAEAELSKATSEEARKRLAFERSKNLYDNEVIARKEFESAEADYRLAQADTRRTSQRLRNLQSSGHENGKFLLRSPLAGVVVERNVNPGQEIRPDNPLYGGYNVNRFGIDINDILEMIEKGELVEEFDLEGKTVLLSFESKSVGDTLAWAPYSIELMKKRKCIIYIISIKMERTVVLSGRKIKLTE